MCLILFAVDSHPQFPLIVAANRDEFYARPTRALQAWPEAPQLLAGKDLTAGGTWLGLTRNGRFAAVTNARDSDVPPQPRSRGALTLDFLLGTSDPATYAEQIWRQGDQYAGFNLLIGDRSGFYYCSNGLSPYDNKPPQRLGPGIYGVANASLDTPWPKVESGKADLRAALGANIDAAALLRILRDDPPGAAMPGGAGPEMLDHVFATRFLRSASYGTRAATALLLNRNGSAEVWEQNFGSDGAPEQLSQYQWQLDPSSAWV